MPSTAPREWTIKGIREAKPEYVPDGDPPVYHAIELVVDGEWELEPGDKLVERASLDRVVEERDRLRGVASALKEALDYCVQYAPDGWLSSTLAQKANDRYAALQSGEGERHEG